VRILVMFAAAALSLAGCGEPSGSSTSVAPAPSASRAQVNPARIERVRAEVPKGFEFTDVGDRTSPAAQWGFGPGWIAQPPQCGTLADPVADPTTSIGWSASGPGGIIYAVVAGSPPSTRPDPATVAECAQWTLAGGRTTGTATVTARPAIDGVPTLALSAAASTVVEGGTETHSHADTITGYLTGYVVSVTVVTDPGSPNPQLGQDFAAMLMAKSVAALHG
jgi:hypothetical protein